METCKSKKEEPTIVIDINGHVGKPPRPLKYPCHICGIVGHKLTNCPKFREMQTMFKDKGKTIENKHVVEIKVVNVSINMVDVHVTIRNKVIEEHVFKNQEPRKNKFVIG